jgi:tetratricopeptide (TPR) repeat protein
MHAWTGLLLVALPLFAADVPQARALYQTTEYTRALALIEGAATPDALRLAGQCHYFLKDYRKAVDVLERAVKLAPRDAATLLWLGRAWGRRAENANPFQAPGFAVKARKALEEAVALDPSLVEAVSDLVQYYVEAPGFLGGGLDKAVRLSESHLKSQDPPQYHYELAQIARKRGQAEAAERELRRAAELAPGSAGRWADLATHLARAGRWEDAEEAFRKAAAAEPKAPGWRMARARALIQAKRNTAEARRLLEEYLRLPLTPDDPPREEVRALLSRLGS